MTDLSKMYSNLSKEELRKIYKDYGDSLIAGKTCKSLVPYTDIYLEQCPYLTTKEATEMATKLMFWEIASRYFTL